jgi:hypothetical protein
VNVTAQALASLRPFAREARIVTECGREYVLLPGLKVRVGNQMRVLDGLLCPSEVHGYKTRLFLSQRIDEKGQNWKEYVMVGATWHAPSWQSVDESLPLPQMLRAHLDAFA